MIFGLDSGHCTGLAAPLHNSIFPLSISLIERASMDSPAHSRDVASSTISVTPKVRALFCLESMAFLDAMLRNEHVNLYA